MPSVKQRVEKLERVLGGSSGKHLAAVVVGPGESREQALNRTLAVDGLTREQLAHVAYFEPESAGFDVEHVLDLECAEVIGCDAFWQTFIETIEKAPGSNATAVVMARLAGEELEHPPSSGALEAGIAALRKARLDAHWK